MWLADDTTLAKSIPLIKPIKPTKPNTATRVSNLCLIIFRHLFFLLFDWFIPIHRGSCQSRGESVCVLV